FRYAGLDKIERRSEICFDPPPRQLSKSQALYVLELKPAEQRGLIMTVRCTGGATPREAAAEAFSEPYRAARRGAVRAQSLGARGRARSRPSPSHRAGRARRCGAGQNPARKTGL